MESHTRCPTLQHLKGQTLSHPQRWILRHVTCLIGGVRAAGQKRLGKSPGPTIGTNSKLTTCIDGIGYELFAHLLQIPNGLEGADLESNEAADSNALASQDVACDVGS